MKQTLLSLLAVLTCAVILACNGADNAKAGEAFSPAGQAPDGVPDSVDSMTDSIMLIADASRIAGSEDAKVWLIIMSDFECPVCKQFFNTVYPQIKKEYLDKGLIRIAYVNFPLSYHTHARAAAEHAMCAGLQRKFWDYHDALFASQDTWTKLPPETAYFDTLALKLKLDMSDYELCVTSGVMKTLISADEVRSSQAGTEATPSFLVGGVPMKGLQQFSTFKKYLDIAIAAARSGGSGE